jgi:hypothetical protein
MSTENILDIVREALTQIAAETIQLIPLIFLALIIISITILLIKIVDMILKRILRYAKIDQMFSSITGFSLPFTLTGLIIFLINLGIALLGIYVIINIFLGPQYIAIMNEALNYSARIFSIVVISIILLAIFNLLIGRIKFETRLRSYAMLIVLLLITAMLVDITALSPPVKQALATGLSLGVGIAIGIFAFWFFFHDYFDRLIKNKFKENVEPEQKEKKTVFECKQE